MKLLELKIPPVLLVIIFALLMQSLSSVLPHLGLTYFLRFSLFLLLSASAILIALSGVWHFKKAKTTVNPTKPESSSSLVQDGIYQYTRNPMYLGMAIFLLGFGIFLNSIYAISLVLGFISYMTLFQIKPEEVALKKVFGKDFQKYQNQTRRWL